MFKKFVLLNLIFLAVLIFGTKVYAANITVDLYVGETSQVFEADASAASLVDSNIAAMDFSPSQDRVNYNYSIDELRGYEFNFYRFSPGFRISNSGVYLYLYTNNIIFRSNAATITVDPEENGMFSIRRNSWYLTYSDGKFNCSTTKNDRAFVYLYEYTDNPDEYSPELPGYKKITSLPYNYKPNQTDWGQFLIVMQDGNAMFVVNSSNDNSTIKISEEVHEMGNVSFTGVTPGTTYATVGNDYYTINVYGPASDVLDDEIEIEVGETYQINPKITISQYSSNDPSIATVNNTTGLVTGVSEGKTFVIATTPNGTSYKIPVTVYEHIYDINIAVDTDSHTKVYYSKNGESLSQVANGTVISERHPRGTFKAYNFYGAPDDGYALVQINSDMTPIVSSTSSEIQNGKYTPYIGSQVAELSANTIASNVNDARLQDAEGVNGLIRTASSTGNVNETIVLRSEKLPTMGVNIYSIDGTPYIDGMKARTGDTIIYEVSIDKDEAGQYLVIEDGVISSALSGSTYIGTSPNGNSVANDVDIAAGNTHSGKYYFSYTVPNNASGTITNNVTFNYDTYSVNSDTSNNISYKTARMLNDSVDVTIGNDSAILFSNTVYGNAGDQDKYFKYKIDIDVANGETFTIIGQDATISYEGSTINTQTTFVKGNDNYIYLKNGQIAKILVSSSSGTNYVGRSYEIEQLDESGYETRINGNIGKKTAGLTIPNVETTVSFTNFREIAPNTNINMTITPFFVLMTLAIGGVILFRKKETD